MRKWWYKIPLFIGIAIVAVLVFGYIVSQLWNHLIPVLFHGPEITFWQAIGLLILSRILFRGFRFGGHRGWGGHRGGMWRKRWQEKMANMTPEEREKFREEWRRRCRGPWGPPAAEEKKDAM